jgi:hypothetical protein
MNLDITNLKSTAINADLSQEDRDAARDQLRSIASRNHDPRNADAKFALTELETTIQLEDQPDKNYPTLLDADLPTTIADFQTRQRALYERYKAEGLTASECVARLREGNVNGALHYGLIEAAVRACENASKTALYRYHLVDVYRRWKSTPHYDWPARELGETTLSKHLPHEWLTRDLFEAMADMELHIKLNLGGNTADPSLRSHPCVELVREIKAKVPGSFAWIPDSVNHVVYSLMQG